MDSNGEAMASLGATGANHRATTPGLHADEETVGTLAANDGRLVSAFHDRLACEIKGEPMIKSTNALFVKETSVQPGIFAARLAPFS